MKRMINYFSCMMLTALLTTTVFAQVKQGVQEPRPLTDKTMSQRLQKDLNTRNAKTGDQSIDWSDSGNGYYGTYSIDQTNYMTRYDKKGNYVETLTRKEWDENVSSSLRTSFDESPYKGNQVNSYWEVSDPNKKGYYMEMSDPTGKVSRVWADDKGKFSDTPYNSDMPAESKSKAK